MSVNAASGHISRAQMPPISAFVSAKPEQQRSHGVGPEAQQSAFVKSAPLAPEAGGTAVGGTLDIKL